MSDKRPDISLIPSEQKKQGFAKATSFRKPKQSFGGSFKILVAVFVIFVLATVGLFFWNQSLASEEEILNGELQGLRAQKDAAAEGEIAELNSLLGSFEFALENHRLWSELFNTIEETTVEGIVFVSFDGDYETGSLSIRGLSPNYNLLAQQVKSFELDENIMRVDVPSVRVDKEGFVDFNLKVLVKKSAI